ncbi:MAG TPA: penicillin-binding protein 2 [Rhizomicrobium sp.]|nr:penicillin-binding protein 2 [Rhizomicrobium sp.]
MPVFDKKDKSRYTTFTRRTLGVSGGMSLVFAVMAGRLYQLQIRDGEEYRTAAEDNRVSERPIAPPRGRVLDRFGAEMANTRRNYRVMIVSEQATQGVRRALDAIGKVITISDQQKKKVLADIAKNKKFVPVPVAENLTWEEFSRINLHLPYLPGVQPDVGETRHYPFGAEMVHVLGYVASVSPDDLKDDTDPLLDMPGYRIGKRGIEKAFDKQVRGKAGDMRVEVNAYGRIVRELGKNPGVPGQDVWLTIDCELQRFADQRLGAESAACVVMDVHTGDVLSLSSTPGFDPNWFNVGLTNTQWKDLTTSDYKPLLNKVMGGTYPPGSTFKTAVALAAVEAGIATPEHRVHCSGVYNFGGHAFHCWQRKGHGTMDIETAIQQSCDVFFYETARRLGIDKIEQTAKKLGLGAPTGIELPGERSGLIPSREWKQKTYKWAWQQGDTISVAIGQGYVTVTPLQLCQMAARVASGKNVSARMVHSVGDRLQPRDPISHLAFSDNSLEVVRRGLDKVCNQPGGTSYAWRIDEPGFEMAGKTGTAQVRVFTREERARGLISNANLAWKLRDHALFIGYAPVHDPRYAIVCMIEHGATPPHPHCQMARDILLFAQKRDTLGRPTAYPVKSAAVPSRTRGAQNRDETGGKEPG